MNYNKQYHLISIHFSGAQLEYKLEEITNVHQTVTWLHDLKSLSDESTIAFEQWLYKGLTHGDCFNWAGLVSCLKKTNIFLQNNLSTRTIESGARFNNRECLISEGKISQKIAYNGILGLRNIDVPRIERYSENSGCKLENNLSYGI